MNGFLKHLDRTKYLRTSLYRQGASSAIIVAILAVETYFRPLAWRVAEYILWMLLSIHWNARTKWRVDRISVGSAQIQLRNWVQAGLINDTRFSIKRLLVVLDLFSNYKACEAFILARCQSTCLFSLVDVYTGGKRLYYLRLLKLTIQKITTEQSPLLAQSRFTQTDTLDISPAPISCSTQPS